MPVLDAVRLGKFVKRGSTTTATVVVTATVAQRGLEGYSSQSCTVDHDNLFWLSHTLVGYSQALQGMQDYGLLAPQLIMSHVHCHANLQINHFICSSRCSV